MQRKRAERVKERTRERTQMWERVGQELEGRMPTRVNVSVQFEVVFPPEELLAHLALEPASAAVGGQVTSQVALTRKHLVREDGVKGDP